MLSFKLAVRNLKKGAKSFFPFFLASVTMFVLTFVTASIGFSPSIHKLRGGDAVAQLMGFALVIMIIFSTLILVYSYRFLQLQRSREFGLYDILGFGKGSIMLVAFFELVLSYIITVLAGTIIGIAFSKFMFLIYVNLINGNYFNLQINPTAIALLAFIFLIFFILLLIIGSFIIWKSSSLDLLKEASKGEKEPKSNIILALIAVILLVAGYYIALSVTNPISAVSKFFIAVLLVIVGTYLFYISFTVWYLRWKKKRPSYYKPNNFITTSSMLYRMKANAVGLGNITILLSMAVVTIVVTLGIFFGIHQVVSEQFPREALVNSQVTTKQMSREAVSESINKTAQKTNTKISDLTTISMVSNIMDNQKLENHQLKIYREENSRNLISVAMTTAADLKNLGNHDKALSRLTDNQILIKDYQGNTEKAQSLDWYGEKFDVLGHLQQITGLPKVSSFTSTSLLIFANDKAMQEAIDSYNNYYHHVEPTVTTNAYALALFDIAPQQANKFGKTLTAQNKNLSMENRTASQEDARAGVGGFVFIGFVLGMSFILGAALIIYYKQLSEGAQDKRSFKILQEVGLSKEEVAKTIKSQVRMIFFLPITVTIIHFGFAYIMVSKIIEVFEISDSTIAQVSILTIILIAVIYYLIYKLTSRVYYKIVER
ncbi:FtsX-like permease family protein [Lactococcus nasutitermitis]|uniref:FtsX-like permease family protein n=1 Tax=Lactococcus nasutitermitis TaxID=1652957 RepID=A0ABV9JBG0_9LACT|nr:FtsX-like permease family protein [Lactococcus nasutitermitis]